MNRAAHPRCSRWVWLARCAWLTPCWWALCCVAPIDQCPAADQVTALRAAKVFVGNGQVLENAVILIRNGRIEAVGPEVAVPENAQVVDLQQAAVTPGLVDAHARVAQADLIPGPQGISAMIPSPADDHQDEHEHDGEHGASDDPNSGVSGDAALGLNDDVDACDPRHALEAGQPLHIPVEGEEDDHDGLPLAIGVSANEVVSEQGSEVVPETRVLDGLNLASRDFERLLRGGVTTVYVSPDPSAVIGPRGTIVHTGGAIPQRVLVPAAAVKATIGSEPSRLGSSNRTPSRYSSSSFYARRPNSRMGLVWVFRKAFYDAQRRARGLEAYGADTASPESTAVLAKVLAGQVPLRIQARLQRDIATALRLSDELGLPFTLEEATEAYRCLDELREHEVPVIFGPIFESPSGLRLRSGEGTRSRYFTFRALLESGITTALSAQELREEDGLARQAMYAMRFGVSLQDTLRAVTQTPAELIGLGSEIGTVEPGKRADLVVWNGEPFASTSDIRAVLIDGQIVVDQR